MKQSKFAIIIFLFTISIIHAQWVQTNGPYVYNIPKRVSVENNEVFLTADYYSVFKLANNVWTWVADPNTANAYPTFVLKHNSKILINGDPLKISSDGGYTWNRITEGMPSSQSSSWGTLPPSTVASMGSVNNIIFVGFYGGLYRSTDEGVSWQKVLSSFIQCITSKDSTIYVSGNGTFKSTDGGNTWIDIGKNGDMNSTSISILATSKFLFVSAPNGVFQSDDDGNTWKRIDNLSVNNYQFVYSMVELNNKIFATQNGNLIFSSNNGETWEKVLGINNSRGLNFISNGKIFVSTSTGIFSSSDVGVTWVKNNAGLEYTNASVQSIAVKDSSIFINTDKGIYQTNDNGKNWNNIKNSSGALCIDGTTIYSGLSKSNDYGKTWVSISNGLPSFRTLSSIIKKDGILLIGTSEGVYISFNDGVNWTVSNKGFNPVSEIYSMISYKGNLYASNWFGVYKSIDNGNSWNYIGLNRISTLASGSNGIYAGSFDSQNVDYQNVYRMSDVTQQWEHILTTNNVHSIILYGQNIFVGTEKGIILSKDDGFTWKEFNEGVNQSQVNCFAINDKYIFAGTRDFSVWKRSIAETITNVVNKDKIIPTTLSLSQNYPNPFNPTTIIEYQIPRQNKVMIKVIDILGRDIAILIDEEKSAGSYSVKFDASNLSSGTYFYQLITNEKVITKKIVLIK